MNTIYVSPDGKDPVMQTIEERVMDRLTGEKEPGDGLSPASAFKTIDGALKHTSGDCEIMLLSQTNDKKWELADLVDINKARVHIIGVK